MSGSESQESADAYSAGTFGGDRPFTLGPELPRVFGRIVTDPPEADPPDDGIARVDGDYAVTLERHGESRALEVVLTANPVRVHSAPSDWQIVVPADRSIEDWARPPDGSQATISFDGRVVFIGRLDTAETDDMAGTTTLEGYGPAGDLLSGSFDLSVSNTEEWRAIQNAWRDLAPDWDVRVIPPDDPKTIDKFETSGSPLDIIQEIHDEFGMRFVVDNRRRYRAQSFPRGKIVRQATWQTLESPSLTRSRGYHNAARVLGARRAANGDRFEAVFVDQEEVDRLVNTLGISEEEATVMWSEDPDPSLETDQSCRNRARSIVSELTEEAERGGDIETVPQIIDPGVSYTIPERDPFRKVGSWAMQFTGDDYIDIPPSVFDGVRDSGTIVAWIRSDWGDDENDRRVFGSSDENPHREIRISNHSYLSIGIGNGETTTWTHAFNTGGSGVGFGDGPFGTDSFGSILTGLPPIDEWILVHWGWQYNADEDQTTIHAGNSGEWIDQSMLSGRIAFPRDSFWIGRHGDEHFRGYLDDVILANSVLGEADLAGLIGGKRLRHALLHARYPFEERIRVGTRVYDVVSGYHGTRTGGTYAGSPVDAERVEYSHARGTASATIGLSKRHLPEYDIEKLKRETRRAKRSV